MTKREWTPTPHAILPHIANLMEKLHTPLLDPCAGDGFALDYLARKWSCSRYGIEVDPVLFPALTSIAKAYNERLEDIYARGFSMIYAYPPPYTRRPVSWIRNVAQASIEGGVVIWRFRKEVLQNPKVIEVLTQVFEDMELFKDPPSTWAEGNHYTIRCRLRAPDEQFTNQGLCFEFAQAIEEAPVLGEALVEEWDTPYSRKMKFRQRGLEWEDVYPELMEALQEMNVPGTGEKLDFTAVKKWFGGIDEEPITNIPDPEMANSSMAQCWCPAFTSTGQGLYAMVLVGRKTAIGSIESQFKRGRTIKIKYAGVKAVGGITGAKENYVVLAKMLPNTGAYVHVWIHHACLKRSKRHLVFVPNERDDVAAKMSSNALGIPIAPEWMNDVSSECGSIYNSGFGIDGRYLDLHKEKIMGALGKKAKDGTLPSPTPITPDKIRPIMPPSVGIWAQLAMQEFINEIPLPGGLIMHAEQIIITDVDTEEAIDGKIEKTTIERKDAVRVTVFHYEGDDAGLWEIFETERMEDDTNGATQPTTNNQGNAQQQPSGHTTAAADLAKHLGGP